MLIGTRTRFSTCNAREATSLHRPLYVYSTISGCMRAGNNLQTHTCRFVDLQGREWELVFCLGNPSPCGFLVDGVQLLGFAFARQILTLPTI